MYVYEEIHTLRPKHPLFKDKETDKHMFLRKVITVMRVWQQQHKSVIKKEMSIREYLVKTGILLYTSTQCRE